jgi:hypothetical protein
LPLTGGSRNSDAEHSEIFGALRGVMRSWSEHLDLIAHRIPESDVERALVAFGLHRLIGQPAKPLPHADRRNARHHDLGWVGRRDLR